MASIHVTTWTLSSLLFSSSSFRQTHCTGILSSTSLRQSVQNSGHEPRQSSLGVGIPLEMKDKSQPGRARGGVAILSDFAFCLCSTLEQPAGSLFGVRGAQGKGSRGPPGGIPRHSVSSVCRGPRSTPCLRQHLLARQLAARAPRAPSARPAARPAPRAPPAGGRWRRGGDKRRPPGPPGLHSAASAKRPPLPSRASSPAAARARERAGLGAALSLPASCKSLACTREDFGGRGLQLSGGSAVDRGQSRVAHAASLPARDPRGARRARSPPPRWGWGAAGRPVPQLCH